MKIVLCMCRQYGVGDGDNVNQRGDDEGNSRGKDDGGGAGGVTVMAIEMWKEALEVRC